ncbi:MAG: hypothetical protein JJU06_19190 [Ectothiorhodospiraceae bacterium]|nr:hypothetical protein [Ectothiorhodospiraceae bacterium]
MDWVTATDLSRWSDERVSEGLLPQLLRRLLYMLTEGRVVLEMPSGDSINTGGWDGIAEVTEGTEHIPPGKSVWEFGTGKAIKGKADGDYDKRTSEPGDITPSETTFLFVTPRRWPIGKKRWSKAKRAEGIWKDVRVLDADDLESMLEQAPAVALWLAERMGKITGSFQSLEEYWNDWSSETDPAVSTDLVLAGREESAKELMQWAATSQASKCAMHAHTQDEAIAFLAAALHLADSEGAEGALARTIIVRDETAFQAVKRWKSPLIVVPKSVDIENPASAVGNGHHVFVPLGFTTERREDIITLFRPTRDVFSAALQRLGFEQAEAEALAVRTGCTLSAYRRHRGAFHRPNWATPDALRLLIPAFLAGAWVDDHRSGIGNERTGDRDFIAALAGQPYVEYRSALTSLTTVPDAPVMRVRGYWRITAPVDAFHLLASYLSDEHLTFLHEKAFELLSQRDPALDLPADERYMAQVRGKVLNHSGVLREGVLGMLALLSHFADAMEHLHTAIRPRDVGFRLVRDLLFGAPAERWLSLAGNLDDLAEVSPTAFLEAVEHSLSQDEPPIMALFEEEGDAFFSGCPHASLLWGLEMLAWEPRHFPRTCRALAGLAARDPGGRWTNRPARSLRNIFLTWRPATFAPLNERMEVLDVVLAEQPTVGWPLLVSLLPRRHDSTSGTRHPHWLPVAGVDQTPKTAEERSLSTQTILDRIEAHLGSDTTRWEELFRVGLSALPPEYRRRLLHALIHRMRSQHESANWEALRTKIRQYHYVLTLHENVDAADIDPLVELEELLSPSEPVARYRWLFEKSWVDIPGARRTEHEVTKEYRSAALDHIVSAYGLEGVIGLVEKVEHPAAVALTAVERSDVNHLDWLVQQRASDEPSAAFWYFLEAYVCLRHGQGGWKWTAALLEHAAENSWPTESILSVFCGLPLTQETWTRLEEGWQGVAKEYWKRVWLRPIDRKDTALRTIAMERALDAGRSAEVIEIFGAFDSAANLPTHLICRALRDLAAEAQNEPQSARNLGHYIKDLFKVLDHRDDISDQEIAVLEIPYCLAFEDTDRSEMAFHRLIAVSPTNFTTLVRWRYQRDDGQQDEEISTEQLRNAAELSWTVLHSWRLIPGSRADGAIDEEELLAWVREAMDLCRAAHRLGSAETCIGELFAYAPAEEDGVWPCRPIRNAVETFASSNLLRGLRAGLISKRGVTSRGIYEGGQQERDLAVLYRTWANAQRARWPAVAAALDGVAEHYEEEAEAHDVNVKRRRLRD